MPDGESTHVTYESPEISRAMLQVATVTVDSHVRKLYDQPALAFGAIMACCEDGCLQGPAAIATPAPVAAQLIAILIADAERQGMQVALQAAIDQMLPVARKIANA